MNKIVSRQYGADLDLEMKEAEHQIRIFAEQLLMRAGREDGLAKRLAEIEALDGPEQEDSAGAGNKDGGQ